MTARSRSSSSVSRAEIRAVVARTEERDALSCGVQTVHFQTDRVHERFLAHRLYDAAGTENRDAADDAKVTVIGLEREFFAVFDRDHNRKSAFVAIFLCRTPERRLDLLTRAGIDGGFADRLRESRTGHTADAAAGRR